MLSIEDAEARRKEIETMDVDGAISAIESELASGGFSSDGNGDWMGTFPLIFSQRPPYGTFSRDSDNDD